MEVIYCKSYSILSEMSTSSKFVNIFVNKFLKTHALQVFGSTIAFVYKFILTQFC